MQGRPVPVFYENKTASTAQYANLLQGIRAAASRSGLQVQLIPEENLSGAALDSLPFNAVVTGTDMPMLQRTISFLRSSGRHAVLAGIDSEPFGPDVSCVTPSRRTETQQLIHYLYKCGRERIAFVGFGENSINDTFRLHSALSTLASLGSPLSGQEVCRWFHDPQESFLHFFQHAQSFDAVICPNDAAAICFIRQCLIREIGVPDDLYVASFGNMAIGRYFRPSVTSMTMDMVSVGEQSFYAWRFLTNNCCAAQTSLKITVPSRVLARESTAGRQPAVENGSIPPAAGNPDPFYENPTIAALQRIERCLSRRDELDLLILKELLQENSYEQISERLFISASALRYRLSKIFADAGVTRRNAFSSLIRTYLGDGNPFFSVE